MSNQDVLKQAEDIAGSLVFIDPADRGSLAGIASSLDALAAELDSDNRDGDAAAARAAAAIARDGAVEGAPAAALEVLGRALEGLQNRLDGSPAAPAAGLGDDQIVSEFLTRQADAMLEIEEVILGLEEGCSQADGEAVKRWIHTLKGESGLLGFADVAEVCHACEDMMQSEPLTACVDRLLAVKDWLQARFDSLSKNTPPPPPASQIIDRLTTPPPPAAVPAPVNLLASDVGLVQDFINEATEHLEAAEGLLLTLDANSRDAEALNAVFRGFHSIKGLAGFCGLEPIKELAHKAENLLDLARKEEIDLAGGLMDLVFESVDMMKRLVEAVRAGLAGDGRMTPDPRLPGLIDRLGKATSPQPAGKCGFIPLARSKPQSPPPAVEPAAATVGGVKLKEAMRVDAERLDRLIDTIGELVIAETMVSHSPEIRRNISAKTAKTLDHLDKISRELQELGMSLRMVPVRPVFQKMARLVRDLARKTGRQIEFAMSGEDTELDKNVVDKIGDPLVHMVRNAVDHGIEDTAEARRAAGKPDHGRIELAAFHKGGSIVIEIKDDGRGLDRQRILKKAYERELLREGEVPLDRDILNLIFEPGFSTAKQVTDISGRGVGMDVVRRNVEELRGTCEIQSEPGRGTVFSIKLPLTLAIIEGMVVSCGHEHYIVPTLSVVRLVRPRPDDISQVFDRGELIAFADEHLPLLRLNKLFNVRDARTEPVEAVVVVAEDEGRRFGLLADDLLGQQSIVIKSLGESMQGTPGVAGAAIMADGNVALILDVSSLARMARATNPAVV